MRYRLAFRRYDAELADQGLVEYLCHVCWELFHRWHLTINALAVAIDSYAGGYN